MIIGITFDKQLMKSKDHAHEVNYYYQGDIGVTKGCVPSVDVSNDVVITEGYFIVKGRLVSIEGSETVDVPTVASGTLYSVLVFEIDLTKINTTTVFNQGSFKVLSNASVYPTPTQQDLDASGTLYQFEFARFENTVGGLVNFSDTRVLLDMSKYATNVELASKAPLASPTFTGTVSGITATMVGLGNVDNTSDANKPVSSATQIALNDKAPLASPTFTGILTTAGQIKFPATQNPSTDANTLDDYEEGTWTPVVYGGTIAGTGTYSGIYGRYIKIGNMVQVIISVAITSHTGTGSMNVSGFPFISIPLVSPVLSITGDILSFSGQLTCILAGNSTNMTIMGVVNGNWMVPVGIDSNCYFTISGCYMAA